MLEEAKAPTGTELQGKLLSNIYKMIILIMGFVQYPHLNTSLAALQEMNCHTDTCMMSHSHTQLINWKTQ